MGEEFDFENNINQIKRFEKINRPITCSSYAGSKKAYTTASKRRDFAALWEGGGGAFFSVGKVKKNHAVSHRFYIEKQQTDG